jgi:hypothetical protein
MKASALLFTVLTLSCYTFGQSQPIVLPHDFCSDFSAATLSCKSFKELVDHGDKEILDILRQQCRAGGGRRGATYVCFKEGADKFLVVSFNMPEEWEKTTLGHLTGESMLCSDEYENGSPGDQRFSSLDWLRLDKYHDPSDANTPVTGKLFDDKLHVTPGETAATVGLSAISVRYSFTNKSGSLTDYKLLIRRSTRRFVETYDADNKTYTETGHCAVFDDTSAPVVVTLNAASGDCKPGKTQCDPMNQQVQSNFLAAFASDPSCRRVRMKKYENYKSAGVYLSITQTHGKWAWMIIGTQHDSGESLDAKGEEANANATAGSICSILNWGGIRD